VPDYVQVNFLLLDGGRLNSIFCALCQDVPRVKESGRTKGRLCIMYGKERKRFMLEAKEDIARKTEA